MSCKQFFTLSIFCISILFFACSKTEEKIAANISAGSATDITETSFVANWTVTSAEISSLRIEVSINTSFAPLHKSSVNVADLTKKSELITGLTGASIYFYRIVAVLNDGSTITTNVKKIETSYHNELVTFATTDGINLAASIKYLKSNTNKKPGIVFMHELGVFVNNWKNAELITRLISQGYVCLVLDFRGHGQSDDFDLMEIAEDLGKVAPDLIAAIDFLKNHQAVDNKNLGLVGGSLGAIMAIAGNGYDEVKCTVSLSGARNGIYSIFQDLEIESSFFISGELDNGGAVDFASEASKLYEIAKEPKKLKIIPDNSAHGTNLLTENGLNQEIIDWINASFDKK